MIIIRVSTARLRLPTSAAAGAFFPISASNSLSPFDVASRSYSSKEAGIIQSRQTSLPQISGVLGLRLASTVDG